MMICLFKKTVNLGWELALGSELAQGGWRDGMQEV